MDPAPVPLSALVNALRQAGLVGLTDTVAELSRVVGRQVETISLQVSNGCNIWVERLVEERQWDQAAQVEHALRSQPQIADLAGEIRPVLPVEVAAGLYAFPIPVRADLVVDSLLQRLLGAPGHGPCLPWFPLLCGGMGAYLRTLHELPLAPSLPRDLPSQNHVIATVRQSLTRAEVGSGSPALCALAKQVASLPRLHKHLVAALDRVATGTNHVLVHGRFSPAYALRPAIGVGDDPARLAAYVFGWLEATFAPPSYDVGYFIGELVEFVDVAREVADEEVERQCRAAARAFYVAYVTRATGTLPSDFPEQVASCAALKIVEHAIRFTSLYGEGGTATHRLLSVADALLDPEQELAQSLLGEARGRTNVI